VGKPPRCENCSDHYEIEGELPDRTISRLRDHEQRLQIWYRTASKRATEYEKRMKAAYEGRQKWKAALVEIAVDHEPVDGGKCMCGANESPCATIRLLEFHNKGIARVVERLTTLTRKQLDLELYGDEPWKADLRLDDDPAAATGSSEPAA
jgi:hypothetical protein